MSKRCAINLNQFWDSAEEVAQVALFIGGKIKSEVPGENLYTPGLFHDCGIAIMASKYHEEYAEVYANASQNFQETLVDLEQRAFTTNHAVLGYFIASNWCLPKDICQIILRHHDKDYLKDAKGSVDQLSYATLKMAENMVSEERRFSSTPEWHYLKTSVLDILGFTDYDYNDIKEDLADTVFR